MTASRMVKLNDDHDEANGPHRHHHSPSRPSLCPNPTPISTVVLQCSAAGRNRVQTWKEKQTNSLIITKQGTKMKTAPKKSCCAMLCYALCVFVRQRPEIRPGPHVGNKQSSLLLVFLSFFRNTTFHQQHPLRTPISKSTAKRRKCFLFPLVITTARDRSILDTSLAKKKKRCSSCYHRHIALLSTDSPHPCVKDKGLPRFLPPSRKTRRYSKTTRLPCSTVCITSRHTHVTACRRPGHTLLWHTK